ncbi:hypothetical protein D3C79_959820 [compost metagenome]
MGAPREGVSQFVRAILWLPLIEAPQLEEQRRLELVQAGAKFIGKVDPSGWWALASGRPPGQERVLDEFVCLDLIAEEGSGTLRAQIVLECQLANLLQHLPLALGG